MEITIVPTYFIHINLFINILTIFILGYLVKIVRALFKKIFDFEEEDGIIVKKQETIVNKQE